MGKKCPVPGCKDYENIDKLNNMWQHFEKHLKSSDVAEWIDIIRKSEDLDDRWKSYLLKRTNQYLFNLFMIDDVNIDENESKSDFNGIYSIESYLQTNQPICREERQFALFFANQLNDNGTEFMELTKAKLGFKEVEVINVYYEATLMRDFWYQDKRKFNKLLWEYLSEKEEEFRLKQYEDTDRHPNYWGQKMKHPLAMWMMNAKPDIAILWKGKEGPGLSFIECKYLSDSDYYSHTDTKIEKSQLSLQEDILDFLCNKAMLSYASKKINKGDVKLVRFILNNKKKSSNEVEVEISELLSNAYK